MSYSKVVIPRLNRLTAMYVDFQGEQGEELTPEKLKDFLIFLESQLLQATMAMRHLDGLRTRQERETLVSLYVETVEMAFQADEPFE